MPTQQENRPQQPDQREGSAPHPPFSECTCEECQCAPEGTWGIPGWENTSGYGVGSGADEAQSH